jgi:hypothetical protein
MGCPSQRAAERAAFAQSERRVRDTFTSAALPVRRVVSQGDGEADVGIGLASQHL